MKRLVLLFTALLLASSISSAAVRAVYRIALRDGSQVLSKDRPIQRGSVVLFHRYPDGVFTSVPEESVLGIQTSAASSGPRPLKPGEVVVLGATAGNPSTPVVSAAGQPAAMPSTVPGGVYDPRIPGYGGAYSSPGTAILSGDLARAMSAAPPTAAEPLVGPNGYPVTPGSPVIIGPDGTPALAPGSAPLTIGPNGTPILAPRGVPGSTPPAIGPNGTPTLAPPGQPGSVPPAAGPNGYPSR